MHQTRKKRVFSAVSLKCVGLLGCVLASACGAPNSAFDPQDAHPLLFKKSKYQQGLSYLDGGLRDNSMVGDASTRARRRRLQWNPGHCTNPKGPALQITTNLNTFDQANAYWLSWLSIQAYRRIEAADQLLRMGLSNVDFIDDRKTSFQAFVGSNDKYVVVSFAGTSDLVDYLTDVTFASKDEIFPGIPGKVHTGFVNVLEKSWPELLELIKKHNGHGKPIILTGHSLGGAQAVISATRLAVMGYTVDSLYIYSVPRIGDETYARFVSHLFPNRVFRFLNNEDLVPRLPPPSVAADAFSKVFPEDAREPVRTVFETLKYSHVGQLLLQNAKGELLPPRTFAESEDAEYWTTVLERSRGRSIPGAVFANWRMLFDHIPFASHCQLKAPQASPIAQVTDFLE